MFCILSQNCQHFFAKNVYILKLSEELKDGIGILVGQAVFKLWIKRVKMLFCSITQELLGQLKLYCYFGVPWTIYYNMHLLFFKQVLTILR